MYYCYGITSKGVRAHNEDAFLIGSSVVTDGFFEAKFTHPFIAAVSDGVSGENSGELASKICLEQLKGFKYKSTSKLENEIMRIHTAMTDYGKAHKKHTNMQATLCALIIDEKNNICSVNVGDSRLYRYRNSVIKQISRDQSLVQMLFEEGKITVYEKNKHIHKNIIFPAMGNISSKPIPYIEILGNDVQYGDLYILCTDGLTDYVAKTEIEAILDEPKSLKKRLSMLIDLALSSGSTDNITIIGVCFN